MHHHFTRPCMVPMFPEEYPLPGTQHKFSLLKGYAQMGSSECGLNMSGHIVAPFQGVGIKRVGFWHKAIQPVLKINTSTLIVVFLDQEAGGSMANKQRTQTFKLATIGDQ